MGRCDIRDWKSVLVTAHLGLGIVLSAATLAGPLPALALVGLAGAALLVGGSGSHPWPDRLRAARLGSAPRR